MRLKVLIADDEPPICRLLEGMIALEELDLEIVGTANDGQTLLGLVETSRPDIVVTDISMPIMDGLEVVGQARRRGLGCRFVLVSGHRSFEYAHAALKSGVDDYILKPIDPDELNAALRKIADDIRSVVPAPSPIDTALRRYFLSKAVRDMRPGETSVESANAAFGTSFRHGLFRILFIKVDHADGVARAPEGSSSLWATFESLVTRRLGPICADILFDRKIDGVIALLNYPPEAEFSLRGTIADLFSSVREAARLPGDFYVTFCVSDAHTEIWETAGSLEEAFATSWSRMLNGVDRILYWQMPSSGIASTFRRKFESLGERMGKACESLDIDGLELCIDEFFAMPMQVLAAPEARLCLKAINKDFFDSTSELIRSYTDEGGLRREIDYMLKMAYTLERYRDTLKSQLSRVLGDIVEFTRRQSARPVRRAIAYVEDNYGKRINLEDVAGVVKLSPVYFSSLFKRETGQNFTDFVTDLRMTKAKELLKRGDLNVNEVADALGFADSRYFSKLFKKHVGLRPTEYREIHS